MNQNLGLLGKKLGNTQLFNEDGSVTRVTVIQVGPCVVLGKRTEKEHGYSALILGFGERTDKNVTKAELGFYKKIGRKASRTVREFRLPADKVDVSGKTRGRGFQGVMRRWNFTGSRDSHGTHEYRRHGGAIGTNMTPGRTFPNLKMAGQYGDERVTTLNLPIAKVLDEEQLLLIEGAVPGARNGIVTVRGAVKARAARA